MMMINCKVTTVLKYAVFLLPFYFLGCSEKDEMFIPPPKLVSTSYTITSPVRVFTNGKEIKDISTIQKFVKRRSAFFFLDTSVSPPVIDPDTIYFPGKDSVRFQNLGYMSITAKDNYFFCFPKDTVSFLTSSNEFYSTFESKIGKHKSFFEYSALPPATGYQGMVRSYRPIIGKWINKRFEIPALTYYSRHHSSGSITRVFSTTNNEFDTNFVTSIEAGDTLMVQGFARVYEEVK